ncbi:MAG: NADH-quinone oxidoreductase subunit F, partial [Desulfofundulus sp.]
MSSSIVAETYKKLQQESRTAWEKLREHPLILVGTATCGRAAGALEVLKVIKEELEKHAITARVLEVGCMGHCYAEPLVTVYKPGFPAISYGYVTAGIAARLVQDFLGGDDPCLEFALAALETNDMVPSFGDFPRGMIEKPVILDKCGLIDPEEIEHYIALGGYAALARALTREPGWVVEEIKASGLRGRGGAGFPTGRKWETCRLEPADEKYVICNADEGDPGAFMDRAILESNPHEVLEGLAIAAYAVGARRGYFYVRAEYPLAVQRVKRAIEQARRYGLLGTGILGSSFSFDVDVFQGSGAFVCGEETALIASMEGEPGLPRHRPPFPATAGLWGKPTVINNVKTLAYVPHIIERGAQWFRGIGTPGSPGTAVFALAGKVVNTGLAEVPMGTTLRELVYDVGSGIPGGKAFKAVQIGGPSGGCLPEAALDMPIDFDSLSQAGA